MRRRTGSGALFALCICALAARPAAAAVVSHVVHISVDGLNPTLLQALLDADDPVTPLYPRVAGIRLHHRRYRV